MRQSRVWSTLLHFLLEYEAVRQESTARTERVRSLQESKRWVPSAICTDSQDAEHIQDKLPDVLETILAKKLGAARNNVHAVRLLK